MSSSWGIRPITLMLVAAMVSFAQAPVFEVASVKPNTAEGRRMSVESSADRFTAFDIGLVPLVLLAYDLNSGRFQDSTTPSTVAMISLQEPSIG